MIPDRDRLERSAAPNGVADKRTDSRLEFLDTSKTTLEQFARRVLAGRKISGGGDKRDGM